VHQEENGRLKESNLKLQIQMNKLSETNLELHSSLTKRPVRCVNRGIFCVGYY